MPYGWEGNRRSGVVLAMRGRLQWFIHLRDESLTEGRWAPAYTPARSMTPFTFTLTSKHAPSLSSCLIMAALWNRGGHYIFVLWFLLSSFFPRLFSAVADWMSTILPHMMWP